MSDYAAFAKAVVENGGGPAFPAETTNPDGSSIWFAGMTLRDWFAGQALNALIEDVNRPSDHEQGDSSEHPRDGIARRAYAIADAMLKARDPSR